ncbi:MAG: flavoprotein [Planctomycetota bacterium]
MNQPASHIDIIVGVTGGIAAFKSAALVSSLAQEGHVVQVVMTESAKKFVGEQTFAALTGRPVASALFDTAYPLGAHIELARNARLLCVAPATAGFMSRAATGASDDLLSTLYLCFTGPVLIAPAMNCEMWEKPAVARNVHQLREDGVQIIDPKEGWLSCRTKGVGRMAEPQDIQNAITSALEQANG